jgi:hypothetical protein
MKLYLSHDHVISYSASNDNLRSRPGECGSSRNNDIATVSTSIIVIKKKLILNDYDKDTDDEN